MSQSEPKGPYIYQPYGIQDKVAWFLGRIYGVAGVSDVTRIDGLTKPEAQAFLAYINKEDSKLLKALKGIVRGPCPIVTHHRPDCEWCAALGAIAEADGNGG